MKKWLLAGLVVVALGVIGLVGARMMATPPDTLDLTRSKTSDDGFFSVAIAPETEPVERGRLHSWIVTVTTPDGAPVTDATLSVDGGMPDHGHGLPTAPQASGHLGEGRYRIEGVRFNMGGWWVLRFVISAPAAEDVAEFNISL